MLLNGHQARDPIVVSRAEIPDTIVSGHAGRPTRALLGVLAPRVQHFVAQAAVFPSVLASCAWRAHRESEPVLQGYLEVLVWHLRWCFPFALDGRLEKSPGTWATCRPEVNPVVCAQACQQPIPPPFP